MHAGNTSIWTQRAGIYPRQKTGKHATCDSILRPSNGCELPLVSMADLGCFQAEIRLNGSTIPGRRFREF